MNNYSHMLPAPTAQTKISATLLDDYQGQPAWSVTTASATYAYHVNGCGLASMIDRDGRDWISFRPTDGPRGVYRGIPNVIHPDGGFHPGASTGITNLISCEIDKVVLESYAFDQKWHCRWSFYQTKAVWELLRADHDYWMLYEGTPGGDYNENEAFSVDSAGTRRKCSEKYEWKIPDPRWIYFSTEGINRSLYLYDKTARPADTLDSFWSMEQAMTVFGFGRVLDSKSDRWCHLDKTPARLEIGLVESADFDSVKKVITGM